jgi:hypothetical protein
MQVYVWLPLGVTLRQARVTHIGIRNTNYQHKHKILLIYVIKARAPITCVRFLLILENSTERLREV